VQAFGQLFIDVEMQRIFKDGKTFVDSIARFDPAWISERYEAEKDAPGFSLRDFVVAHFELPEDAASDFRPNPSHGLFQNIEALWPHLTRRARTPAEVRERDSLLNLPEQYVVPGGRFREIYYWDSYFTMLGLVVSGHMDLAASMVRNFAFLIDRYGLVPNGNRSYYLSRSQPPFFFKMVQLLCEHAPAAEYARYLPQLVKEHAYWMAGADGLQPGQAARRVVCLPDGGLLNRYWDERDTPRSEMYREDVLTAGASSRPNDEVYRDLRAAAESGWDFSSRWNAEEKDLSTIQTTAIVPVDLNCMLHGLESAIALGCGHAGDEAGRADYAAKAERRHAAIQQHLWHAGQGHYVDYHWTRRKQCTALTLATAFPLFTGVASDGQAALVASCIAQGLLKDHGLAATTVASGQQWDLPNGWAPLHWVAVDGLARYGHGELARDIATRWVRTVDRVYRETGKLLEKYDVTTPQAGGGGEYPTQDGFGWTNGVTVKLMTLYPDVLGGLPVEALEHASPAPGRILEVTPPSPQPAPTSGSGGSTPSPP
jgi:alpha,alpha-trehalase